MIICIFISGCQRKLSYETKDAISVGMIETTADINMNKIVTTTEPVTTVMPLPTPIYTPKPSLELEQITLLVVGDNLIHEEVIESGLQNGRKYEYDHLFTKLRKQIRTADIAVINQETILGGTTLGCSGYPTFNSPTQIGDAIVKAGFDVVLHASNHTMDKGKKGVTNTLSFWKKYPDIAVLGIHESKKNQDTVRIINKNGIKLAMLNATYGLNGITLSQKNAYLVDLIDKEQLSKQIKMAKKKADVVVVFAHWGTEYVYEPDEYQKKWARFFADQGVDLVIGGHPHVIQPVEWIEGQDGHNMLIYYSLGNYISYQKKAPRMLGAMAKVTFLKEEKKVVIREASVTPIITHYETKQDYNFATYLLSDYTQQLAEKHGVIEKEDNSQFSLNNMKKLSKMVLGDWKETSIKR